MTASPLMKEELQKLDEITAQAWYMTGRNISALSDLYADKDNNQIEMDRLIHRRHLQKNTQSLTRRKKEASRLQSSIQIMIHRMVITSHNSHICTMPHNAVFYPDRR